jgi:putative zinc finger/helix-turn-helix YgiT family protein
MRGSEEGATMKTMKCTRCGTTMHATVQTNHRYTECGLDNVVLVGVEVRTCKQCGNESVVIPRITELHKKLAQMVAVKAEKLAPAEIKFLRKYLGWSGADFARYVGVTAETVSRWENGAQTMGPVSERLLRLCALKVDPVDDYTVLGKMATEEAQPREIQMTITTEWKAAG